MKSENSQDKLAVTHFQRKPYPVGSYSVEFIFSDVRDRLKNRVDFRVRVASRYSTGVLNRLINTLEAMFYQSAINHVTGDIHYVTFLLRKNKTILTVLDCVFLEQGSKVKRAVYRIIWLLLPVYKVKYITAISEATKQRILRETEFDPDKIFVIPIGVSNIFTPHPKSFSKDYPTLLHVGTTPNKNLERLIPAIDGLSCELIIIGELTKGVRRLLEKHRITYKNRWHLNALQMLEEYKRCDILVFASTYEGFGMPIIEANFVERAVVAGNNSSMIEVAGDAACLVDAHSIEDIREGILRVIEDDVYRERLIENGRKNRMRFDSQSIAEQYYTLYQKIAITKRSTMSCVED